MTNRNLLLKIVGNHNIFLSQFCVQKCLVSIGPKCLAIDLTRFDVRCSHIPSYLLLLPKDRNFTLEKNQDLFSSSLTFCWLKWDPKIESAWPFVTSKQQHFLNEETVRWFNYVLYVPSFLGSSIDDVTHTYFSAFLLCTIFLPS